MLHLRQHGSVAAAERGRVIREFHEPDCSLDKSQPAHLSRNPQSGVSRNPMFHSVQDIQTHRSMFRSVLDIRTHKYQESDVSVGPRHTNPQSGVSRNPMFRSVIDKQTHMSMFRSVLDIQTHKYQKSDV